MPACTVRRSSLSSEISSTARPPGEIRTSLTVKSTGNEICVRGLTVRIAIAGA
jgi:hypothetical protein